MAGTVTVKDVLWRIGSVLQDTSPQFARWTERELVNWLNDAHLAIAKFLPTASSRVDAIKLKAGSRQSIESIAAADCKPGDGTTPAVAILGTQVLDVIRNMGADGLSPGRAIRVVDREVLDAISPDWHATTAATVSQFMADPRMPRYFYVTPAVPGTPAVWAEIAYTAQPIAIPNTGSAGSELYLIGGASTTKISLADEHVDDLVNYVCARAYMKNAQFAGNDAKVAQFTGQFVGSLNAKVSALTGHNPNLQRLPLAMSPAGAAS